MGGSRAGGRKGQGVRGGLSAPLPLLLVMLVERERQIAARREKKNKKERTKDLWREIEVAPGHGHEE